MTGQTTDLYQGCAGLLHVGAEASVSLTSSCYRCACAPAAAVYTSLRAQQLLTLEGGFRCIAKVLLLLLPAAKVADHRKSATETVPAWADTSASTFIEYLTQTFALLFNLAYFSALTSLFLMWLVCCPTVSFSFCLGGSDPPSSSRCRFLLFGLLLMFNAAVSQQC